MSKEPVPKSKGRSGSGLGSMFIRLSAVGIQLVVYVLLMAYAGHQLDAATCTVKPWWTIGFSLFGAASGMVWLIHKLGKLK